MKAKQIYESETGNEKMERIIKLFLIFICNLL